MSWQDSPAILIQVAYIWIIALEWVDNANYRQIPNDRDLQPIAIATGSRYLHRRMNGTRRFIVNSGPVNQYIDNDRPIRHQQDMNDDDDDYRRLVGCPKLIDLY